MVDLHFHDLPEVEPFEYFCTNCKRCCYCIVDLKNCSFCGTPITITGKPGELDLEALRAPYKETKNL